MPDTTEEAKRYNRIKIRLKLFDLLFLVCYLILFQVLFSSSFKNFALANFSAQLFAFTIYLLGFSSLYYVLDFPIHFYSSFILERKFNLSNQSFFGWIKDEIKGGLLSFLLFLLFVHALYIFLRNFEETWWIWMALFWFVLTIIIAKVTPVLIIPLFFKYSTVEDRVRKRVMDISRKCGIKILNVYKIDFSKKTRKLNAALVGLGKSRRVILADNLIEDFTDDEIAGVLAHEFAHHKLFHIWKLMAFGFLAIFFSFYILNVISSKLIFMLKGDNIYDMKIFPSFMLVLFLTTFAILPLQNAFSRKLEKDADIFALDVTADREAFVSLMNKLAKRNLSDTNPPRWVKYMFYDHPPISERIKLAKDFK